MKTKFTLLAIVLLTFLLSFSTGPENKLEGTWKLVSGKYIFPDDTLAVPRTESEHAIKVLNKTHFATIHQDASKKEIYSNAGTYVLTEDTYTEYQEFNSGINSIGRTHAFESKIEGDIWTITGPVEKSEADVPEWKMHEVWKRVK